MHLREIYYGTLIFQQSSMICIALSENYFLLVTCYKCLIVTLRCAVNVTTLSFQQFP